jgi:hypothetical protein
MLMGDYVIEGSIVPICQLYYYGICRKWMMKLANLRLLLFSQRMYIFANKLQAT